MWKELMPDASLVKWDATSPNISPRGLLLLHLPTPHHLFVNFNTTTCIASNNPTSFGHSWSHE
jgi:hypothetical protein